MTTAPIPFQPRRFRSAAQHYLQGRPAYAQRLFERVAEACELKPTDTVLDLGCGPGQLALGFAPFVASVTAVDPEPEMLKIAEQSAANAGFDIHCVTGSSYDIGPELGRFKIATIGRAFHWMDRADTLKRLDRMIDAEGAVVLFRDQHIEVTENDWRKSYRALLDRYSAEDDARRMRKSDYWTNHEAVLFDSSFSVLERIGVIERRLTPVEQIENRMLSLSSVSHAQIGEKADRMVEELRTMLADFAVDGAVQEVVESQALIARR
ncbi:MAG TPA: methyltransferase domain-containing protein [Dongiaceae bacterium]